MKQEEDTGKSKKEDRRKKAASGKSGGGTQGRETKTKATKNKARGRKGGTRESDSDEDCQKGSASGESVIEFLSVEDMQTEITNFSELMDCPEELVEELTKHLHSPMTKHFQEVAKSVFMATVAVGGDVRRKTHQQLQDKVSALLTTIKLSEKSIKVCGNWS